MLAADELQAPVGYDGHWVLLALLFLALVAGYYAAVLWWGRPRRGARPNAPPRAQCLTRLDAIESAVSAGRISPREGHQQISETVRTFVADASGIPARTMTLTDIERSGPAELAAVVATVYPPEFAPGEELAGQQLDTALERARGLVSSWN